MGTATGTTYTDARFSPQGTWFCYQVLTSYSSWTSVNSNPTVAVRLGFFASSVVFFSLNLIGFGLGPICTGMLSDAWRPTHGVDALRYAMLVTLLIGTAGGICMHHLASRHLVRDLGGKALGRN